MRKQIWIPLVVVLAVCLLLLLETTKHQHVTLPVQNVVSANQPEQPTAVENHLVSDTSKTTTVPLIATAPKAVPGDSSVTNSQLLADWQAPIEFYGKVIDENSNPVAGANIIFKWPEIPAPDGNRTATTESDAAGLFALRDKRGPSLAIWVSKDGYYASHRGQWGFNYALGPDIISPNPQNPVILQLHKKGTPEPLIEKIFPPGMGQIWQLHHDGTPIQLDLLNGSQNPNGNGQIKLEFWRDISGMNKQPFDWKLQLTVSGGGLVGTDQEFPFEAPENGYQPSIVLNMSVTNQDWIGDLRTKYYIQLSNGNYGRIDFYLLPGNGVFTIKSWINPSGSRNLEPP